MSVRELLYGALGVIALVLGWYYNLQYLEQPGAGWVDWMKQCMVNPAAASALMDLSLTYAIIGLWIAFESKRIGLRWGWLAIPVTVFVSLGFGLAGFLIFRERRLRALPAS